MRSGQWIVSMFCALRRKFVYLLSNLLLNKVIKPKFRSLLNLYFFYGINIFGIKERGLSRFSQRSIVVLKGKLRRSNTLSGKFVSISLDYRWNYTSRQQPPFLADSPYTASCFNLSTTATCPQWPLSSVLKVAVVERFKCKLWLRPSGNSAEVLVLGPHLCTRIKVRVIIGLLKSHCRFANQVATQASLQGLRTF